jgi:hypothetical protein
MPTNADLARSIQALDHTLSEVLVLLYHVVQANQKLTEALDRPRAMPVEAANGYDVRALMPWIRGEKSQ